MRGLVLVTLTGGALLIPIQLARGAPRTRLAFLSARLPAPETDFRAAESSEAAGPRVRPPAGPELTAPFPLSHLGFRWRGDEDGLVEMRLAKAEGPWSAWRSVLPDHDLEGEEESDTHLSQLVRAGGTTQVQVRAGAEVSGVELVAIDAVHGPRPWVLASARPARAAEPDGGEDRGGTTASSGTRSTAGTSSRVSQPKVVTRAEWGADESIRKTQNPIKYSPLRKLFVHHTVTAPEGPDPDPAATVRAIYTYHVQGNGWDDIGYNFLIDSAGRIYEGRWARSYTPDEIPTGEDLSGQGVQGAHVAGHNAGSVGVSLIGDFSGAEPTSAAMDSLYRMMAWKADRHGVDVSRSDPYLNSDGVSEVFPNLAGHRDAGRTACPGDRLYPLLPKIRERVSRVVQVAYSSVPGYWTATADGRVLAYGNAEPFGSLQGASLSAPISGMAVTPSGKGYWLMGGDGGVFTYGDARFFGSTGAMKLNAPVVRLEPTPTGKGYWLLAADGGIFTFGDAAFFGSTGAMKLNAPVVGMAATPSGKGYWLVATDGGIFTFGDAGFYGSTGSLTLNSPIISMAPGPRGKGYWLVARDGGVFAFDVPFHGSIPQSSGAKGYAGTVQIRITPGGKGYYLADVSGAVYTFGDAPFHGAQASQRPPNGAVDLALMP
jgi:N-acetylmuramoyl-L-alanine amidase-like protein